MADTASIVRRQDAQLVVVDIQQRLAAVMPRREQVLGSSVKLVGVATLVGWPIVATRQNPAGLGGFEPPIDEALTAAEAGSATRVVRVDKLAFDCFAEPAFAEAVALSARRQLVFVGMESHICVAQTALAALRAGFEAFVVADACCSREESAHELALARLRSAGAVVTSWESVAYEAVAFAGTDEFRALLGIVKA